MGTASHNSHDMPTRNPRPSNARATVIAILQARLADIVDLSLSTKQAHWNIKGPQFIAVHEMLDQFYTQQAEWVDDVAERIVQLGGIARGTVQAVVQETNLAPYATGLVTIPEHISALVERSVQLVHIIAKNIDDSDEAGDTNTADLLTGISRVLEKQLWQLEAHVAPGITP